jgi:hypothetical protein
MLNNEQLRYLSKKKLTWHPLLTSQPKALAEHVLQFGPSVN